MSRNTQLKLLIKNYLNSKQGITININMITNEINITNNKRLGDNFILFIEYDICKNEITSKHYNSMRNIYTVRVSKNKKIREDLFIILEKLILL